MTPASEPTAPAVVVAVAVFVVIVGFASGVI